jgi:hypothetical protein
MGTFVHYIDIAAILNGLGIACSLALILFLLLNRRKYGRMVLKAQTGKKVPAGFADQVSLHMMTQQSQKAYDNLQQSLAKEFASLRLMGEGAVRQASDHGRFPKSNVDVGRERRRRYRLAEEMMNRGASADRISQQCGLMDGELELLRGLTELANEKTQGNMFEPRTTVAM